ncbi:MAG: secretin and TonB N-terminal domain-containing protein [Syntrophaceae bacterium]
MKKLSLWALTISFCGLLVAGCATMNAGPESSDPTAGAGVKPAAAAAEASVGYVEKITFDKTADKERVIVSTSRLSGYTASREAARTFVITFDKMHVPDDLKTKRPDGSFKVIEGVYSSQTKTGERPVTAVKIVLKDAVPHLVREEGNQLTIDVDIANMPRSFTMTKEVEKIRATQPEPKAKEIKVEKKEGKVYTGQKITADFQDANIRSVFRLIAEVSGLNIVAGEDVKGLVTMKLNEVPWDQALETILDIQQLGTKAQGNVIVVMPADKIKKAEEQRLKEDVSRGKLKQISIEAQIVEAVDTFVRRIGVQWGGGILTNAGNTQLGALGGSAGYATGLTAGSASAITIPQNFPNGVGFTSTNQAVNFPYTFPGTPALGVLIGGANFVLSAQIHALESSNEGKIISSPKVTTLDNVKATIKQGEEVPYVTESTPGRVVTRTVQFKEAVLKLDVKPTITPEGKISMEIKATNDYPDYSRSIVGNPPIIKNEVDSTVVVHDGDTIVIGGIYKSNDLKGTSGVPALYKIPVLGWLFRADEETRTKREILIFITPRVVSDNRGS